jgi:hypothetical protein
VIKRRAGNLVWKTAFKSGKFNSVKRFEYLIIV